MKDAFEQLMREADKPTQVPEGIAKYVDALVKGTHEITSVTIRPKRTWVGLTDEDMRSKFEQWHRANFVQPLDLYNNSYRNMHVRNRWQGWVAAHGIKENT